MAALEIIEEAASRTLDEMRTMVGVLREGEEPDFVPQPGVTDIARLARRTGDWPRVDVELSGDFDDLAPSVGAAIYRLAQESITNAVRHARHATRISVRVADDERLRAPNRPRRRRWQPDRSGLVGLRPRRHDRAGHTCSAAPSRPVPTPTAVGRSTRCCRKRVREHEGPCARR